MTTSADLHPDRLPGYDGGPLAHLPEVLDEPRFWLGHLHPCLQGKRARRLLIGADHASNRFHRDLSERADWPTFTVPVAGGRLYVVYRNDEEAPGTDYLLHHPAWDRAELLARDDVHFMGPGLSWPELASAADNGLDGGSTTDADSRLLLLLPAFGDVAAPAAAVERVAAALRARTTVEKPELLAAAMLEDHGHYGPTTWTTTGDGHRINDGRYSFRNPAKGFALSADRLARVTSALS
ncbi:hypothetical protein ACFRMQ_36375 [Kitasatospora sp. NPDC056783]|uniref:hypothetical protein n=1 Tax=Kitasatospora sp. NPDC056783 TaxID=3345943 RepID=UPI0036A721A2